MNIIKKPIYTHITSLTKPRKIKYIVIHYTAGSNSKEGTALVTRNVFLNRKASADFVVDDKDIVQVNPDLERYYCWAVGDGKGKKGITNSNSISIEICSTRKKNTSFAVPNHSGWYFTDDVINNAVELVKYLMSKFNIDIDHVVRHYDASGKLCPGIIGWNDGKIYSEDGTNIIGNNNSLSWKNFKVRVSDK